jgi:hypothetical protein
MTALMEVPICGHATVVELLLAAKADKNLKGKVSPPHPPDRERGRKTLPPNAYMCTPTLKKEPHVPSRLWA